MKSKNRIRRNGASKVVKPQAKTAPLKYVTVIFYSTEDGKEMFRVELPEVLLAAVRRAAKKMKITVGRFFELAVQHKIGRELPANSRTLLSTPLIGGAR